MRTPSSPRDVIFTATETLFSRHRSCRTQPGTDGSNPSLSSGESANHRFRRRFHGLDVRGSPPRTRVSTGEMGSLHELRIVGVVLSPEYVFATKSGDPLPDDKQFGILWMGHKAA